MNSFHICNVFLQGTAFSLKERQILGIHGLLPPTVSTQEQQIERVLKNFRRYQNDLDKYVYMVSLQDRNTRLYYSVLAQHIEEMAPIVYTPTVGKACQRYGFIFRRPRSVVTPQNCCERMNEYVLLHSAQQTSPRRC